MIEAPAFRKWFPVVALFTLLAGEAWRYSISWFGFAAIALTLTAFSVWLLIHHRDRWSLKGLPLPLLVFLGFATASIVWSFYPGATALGLAATYLTVIGGAALAIAFDWNELLRALGLALRWILGLSLLFELVVSIVVQRPLLPFFTDYGDEKVPIMYYWSRNLLFEGDRIQGIVGNSSLLAFLALLGVIVFTIQLAAEKVTLKADLFWLALAGGHIALTRSATITVALLAIPALVGVVLLMRRVATRSVRLSHYLASTIIVGGLAIVGAAVYFFRGPLLASLGKSDDLTGRLEIWRIVATMASERPLFGWGWVSYWVPWVEPFDNLVIRNNVVQLHAHNAWLDVWMQLGLVGLAVFAALMITTAVRAWLVATDREAIPPAGVRRHGAVSLLPLLLLAALVLQSLAESRLLVEYGLALLVMIAVSTKTSTRETARRESILRT